MGTHTVAEARNHLSKLIKHALKGESVIITLHGQPVVELRPVRSVPRPITPEDIEWLRAHRVTPSRVTEDAATLVRRMRDEEDH